MARAMNASEPPAGDPAAAGDAYVATPELAQHLDLLHHLIQYSDLLLVVRGARGAGKTALLERLVAAAGEGWRICRIEASAALDEQRILEALCAGFGLREHGGPRIELLKSHLEALHRSHQVALVAVDDAHRLPPATLELLLDLASGWEGFKARVLLLYEGHDFPAPGSPVEEIAHVVDLPPLDEAHTASYLRQRLAAAGIEPGESPFTPAVVRSIHKASGGLPGAIDSLASQVLASRRPAPAAAARAVRWWMPVAAATVIAALALTLFYRSGPGPGEAPGPIVAPPAVRPAAVPAAAPAGRQAPGAATIMPEAAEGAAGEAGPSAGDGERQRLAAARAQGEPAPGPPPPAAGAAAGRQPVGPEPPSPPDGALGGEPAARPGETLASAAEGLRPAAQRREEPAAAPPAAPASEAEQGAPGEEGTVASPSLPAGGPEVGSPGAEAAPAAPEAPAGAERRAQQPSEPPSQPSGPPPGGSPEAPPAPLAGLARGPDWVLAQPDSRFTIQLMGSHDPQALRRFVRANRIAERAAWYPTRFRGRPWYVVVYGLYPSREAARTAIARLPRALREGSPWARPIGDIRPLITR